MREVEQRLERKDRRRFQYRYTTLVRRVARKPKEQ